MPTVNDHSVAAAVERLRRIEAGESPLRVYVPLLPGESYNEHTSQIVDSLIRDDRRTLSDAYQAETVGLRKELAANRDILVELRNKHLSHCAAVVLAIVQKRIEAADALLGCVFVPIHTTDEELDRAFDEAPEVPMSKEEIDRIVDDVTGRKRGDADAG